MVIIKYTYGEIDKIDDHIRMCRLIRAVVKIDTIVCITLHVLLCILWMIDCFREQLD